MHAARLVAGDKLVEVFALNRRLFQSEVDVRAQVINPEPVRPRFGPAFFLIEEDDVRLHAGRIPDAGRQPQQRMDTAGRCGIQAAARLGCDGVSNSEISEKPLAGTSAIFSKVSLAARAAGRFEIPPEIVQVRIAAQGTMEGVRELSSLSPKHP